jgi:hypothetical protein
MLSNGSIKLLVVGKIGNGETGYKERALNKTTGMCLELSYSYNPGEMRAIDYKYVRVTGY